MRCDPHDSTRSQELVLTLRNATPAHLHLIRPDDRTRLQRGVREMSRTSRFMHFFASTRELTEEQARYFTQVRPDPPRRGPRG